MLWYIYICDPWKKSSSKGTPVLVEDIRIILVIQNLGHLGVENLMAEMAPHAGPAI